MERVLPFRDAVVDAVLNRSAAGIVNDTNMAAAIRHAATGGGAVQDYSAMAERDVRLVNDAVFSPALTQEMIPPMFTVDSALPVSAMMRGDDRLYTMEDVFTESNVTALSIMYAQSIRAYSYNAVDADAVRANAVQNVMLEDDSADAELLMKCVPVVDAVAASVVMRATDMRFVHARTTMRVVFSMAKSMLFRDCARGVSIPFSLTSSTGDRHTMEVSDPPYTRTNVRDANTNVDSMLAARNDWLRKAWTLFVLLCYGQEKQRDFPPEALERLFTGDRGEELWSDRQVRGRTIHPSMLATYSALLTRYLFSPEVFESVSRDPTSKRAKKSVSAARDYISRIGAVNMALVCYYIHRAVRKIELAGESQNELAGGPPNDCGDTFVHRDPELCLWFWPECRGGFDRSRVDARDAKSTRPTSSLLREAAVHTHSLRATRTAAVALPEEYWRPHDAQDTAAAVTEDSYFAPSFLELSYAVGVAQAKAADPATADDSVDELLQLVAVKAEALRMSVRKHEKQLAVMLDEGVAPTYHQRAMVDASLSSWPGDEEWTLASPDNPASSYARIGSSVEGEKTVLSGAGKMKQFRACRTLDVLQTDIAMGKKLLRTVEALLAADYSEAREDLDVPCAQPAAAEAEDEDEGDFEEVPLVFAADSAPAHSFDRLRRMRPAVLADGDQPGGAAGQAGMAASSSIPTPDEDDGMSSAAALLSATSSTAASSLPGIVSASSSTATA